MIAAAAEEALETVLAEISAGATKDDCGWCWKQPGEKCLPGGTHMARFVRAQRHSHITSAEFALVADALGAFTLETVLYVTREAVLAA